MFNTKTENFKYYHVAKGLYLTSNNVVIDFYKIGSFRYMKAIHKSGLNILYLDNPIKPQKEVLAVIQLFLEKYNFDCSVDEVRNELESDELLAVNLRHEQEQIKKSAAYKFFNQ